MRKYVFIFGVAYLVLTICLALLLTAMNVNSSFNIAIAMSASFAAAARFKKDYGRVPTAEEKSTYAKGALLFSFVASLIMVSVVLVSIFSFREISSMVNLLLTPRYLAIALVATLIVGIIYYFIIKWSFSWFAKIAKA